MSSILKALEKARKERERQLQEKEKKKKRLESIKREGIARKPPEDDSTRRTQPSQAGYPGRFLVLAFLFFVLGVGVLVISVYFFLKVQNMLSSVPPGESITKNEVVSRERTEVAHLQKRIIVEEPVEKVTPSAKPNTEEKQYTGRMEKPASATPIIKQQKEIRERKTVQVSPTSGSPMKPVPGSSTEELKVAKKLTSLTRVGQMKPTLIAQKTQPEVLEKALPEKKLSSFNHKKEVIPTPKPIPMAVYTPEKRPEIKLPTPTPEPPLNEQPGTIKDISAEKLGLQVGGIFWDEKKPMAIINGVVVGEGDYIRDIKILKIYRRSIRVEKDSTIYNVLF